jgi:hypothetical protein
VDGFTAAEAHSDRLIAKAVNDVVADGAVLLVGGELGNPVGDFGYVGRLINGVFIRG